VRQESRESVANGIAVGTQARAKAGAGITVRFSLISALGVGG
jgi:hypothetical protein